MNADIALPLGLRFYVLLGLFVGDTVSQAVRQMVTAADVRSGNRCAAGTTKIWF
jgi:hypothetical protein